MLRLENNSSHLIACFLLVLLLIIAILRQDCFALKIISNYPGVEEISGWSRVEHIAALSLPAACLSYSPFPPLAKNSQPNNVPLRYLALLPQPKGKSLKDFIDVYAQRKDKEDALTDLQRIYYVFGRQLCNFHKRYDNSCLLQCDSFVL